MGFIIMPTGEDLMATNVITIDVHKSAFEAAQLMTYHGVGDLVIMDKEVPIGMFTERDFVRRIVTKKKDHLTSRSLR